MALSFGSGSDWVDLGGGSSIPNAFANAGSCLMWVKPSAVPPVAAGSFIRGVSQHVLADNTTFLQLTIGRATQSLLATATYANVATYTANAWCFVAFTWDTAAAAGSQQIYHGSLSTGVAEAAAYGTQRPGSGAVSSPMGDPIVGATNSGTVAFVGSIAWMGVWNVKLTLRQLADQQYSPHVTSGSVLFTHFGFNGTSTQPDWSGNGNAGTVNGSAVTAHAPLGSPFSRPNQFAYQRFWPAWAGRSKQIGSGLYV